MVAQSKEAQQEKLLSIEEFLEIAMRPENEDRRLELHDGVIVEKGEPVELKNGEIIMVSRRKNSRLALFLGAYLLEFVVPRELGELTTADGGYEIGPGKMYMPDVGFIARERITGTDDDVTFEVAPDLAVEVISPNETPRSVQRKTRNYLKAGTRLVWNVYGPQQEIDVCTLSEAGELVISTLTITDTLDGSDVLPGFRLELAKLFGNLALGKVEAPSEPTNDENN
jgi:Uma2 family endonuclease